MKISELLTRNHDVCLLIPKLGFHLAEKYLKPFHRNNTEVYATLFEKRCYKSVYLIHLFRCIKSIYISLRSRAGYDIIIANSHLPFDIIPSILFKLKNRAKLIVYFHGGKPCLTRERTFTTVVPEMFFYLGLFLSKKFADLLFIVNNLIRNYLIRWGMNPRNVVLTSNGIDYKEILGIDGGEKEYEGVFMGRMSAIKGIYDLLETWKTVVKKYPFAKLCVIGGGPELEGLKAKVKECKFEGNVTVVGECYGEKKYKLIKKSKVFIYPTHEESWGVVIAEAMACGLPVVTYDLPCLKETFGKYLFAVQPKNVRAMAEKIIDILEHYEGCKTVVEDAKNLTSKYDWKNVLAYELFHISKMLA